MAAGNRTINVKALPKEGRPLDFSGAVGSFDFEIDTNKSQLKATEALQATVKVSGKGNLKLFELPKLTLPSSLEVYEPEHSENVSTTLTGMQGQISDTYTIVPSFQGKYPIPSVSFSYFDLNTKRYKTITSDELVINVNEGPINDENDAENNTTSLIKEPITQSGGQFLSFKTKTNFIPIESPYFYKSKLFWIFLLVPFLAIPIGSAPAFLRSRDCFSLVARCEQDQKGTCICMR